LAAELLLGWPLLAAVVLGGVTYVSSSGIAAKLLGELGRLGNRETPILLSVLVTEDLAMAAYLPILTGLLAGSLLAKIMPVVVALGAVAVVLAATLRWGHTISRLVFTPNDEVLLLVVVGLALSSGHWPRPRCWHWRCWARCWPPPPTRWRPPWPGRPAPPRTSWPALPPPQPAPTPTPHYPTTATTTSAPHERPAGPPT
jgi:Sodium/hydrogen exchanger family